MRHLLHLRHLPCPGRPGRTLSVASAATAAVVAGVMAGSLLAAAPAASTGPAAPSGGSVADVGDRLDAPALLARPNAGKVNLGRNISWGTRAAAESPTCHATRPICVHWTENGDHAVPLADGDADDIPDQVEQTLDAVDTSWATIVGQLGFREPLKDGTSPVNGGDNRFDVYLADTGRANLAGYTSSDDPHLADGSNYRFRDASAFVVLDNDYRTGQFPTGTSLANLRVSAAHELFHAVQFAYDYREDTWMTEGTAAWVEDMVFTDINLNRSHLQHSPLSAPLTPLDFGRQGHQYGSWLFFRYLSERFGRGIVAKIWRFADDSAQQVSTNNAETYSMRAIRRAIAREGRDFRRVFADFVRVNLRPAKGYREGSTYPKPFTPRLFLGPRGDDTGWLGTEIDHLASLTVTFAPADTAPPNRRLLVRVDGPARAASPAARVVVRFESGRSRVVGVRLSRKGNGDVRVPFGKAKVASVDVALINAGTRYRDCFKKNTAYSCRGVPRDDNRVFKVRARVL